MDESSDPSQQAKDDEKVRQLLLEASNPPKKPRAPLLQTLAQPSLSFKLSKETTPNMYESFKKTRLISAEEHKEERKHPTPIWAAQRDTHGKLVDDFDVDDPVPVPVGGADEQSRPTKKYKRTHRGDNQYGEHRNPNEGKMTFTEGDNQKDRDFFS